MVKTEFAIPGMYISRTDIMAMYMYDPTLSDKEAFEKAYKLTDEQMEFLADDFAEVFFNVYDGMFRKILIVALQNLERREE
jgi:hypothetical protein